MAGAGTRGWSGTAFSIPPRLARRSGGHSSTLSLGAPYPVQPEALSAGHPPQSRTATPPTLRCRIQLPAQPPHYGGQSVSALGAGLSHNQHCHLQGVNRRAGSSLIFILEFYPEKRNPQFIFRKREQPPELYLDFL